MEAPQHSRKIRLGCRETGMGAKTGFMPTPDQCSRVKKFNSSKTGNHWDEEFEILDGESISVIDVSNTGKCNCYYFTLQRGEVVRKSEHERGAHGECGVCGKLY